MGVIPKTLLGMETSNKGVNPAKEKVWNSWREDTYIIVFTTLLGNENAHACLKLFSVMLHKEWECCAIFGGCHALMFMHEGWSNFPVWGGIRLNCLVSCTICGNKFQNSISSVGSKGIRPCGRK